MEQSGGIWWAERISIRETWAAPTILFCFNNTFWSCDTLIVYRFCSLERTQDLDPECNFPPVDSVPHETPRTFSNSVILILSSHVQGLLPDVLLALY